MGLHGQALARKIEAQRDFAGHVVDPDPTDMVAHEVSIVLLLLPPYGSLFWIRSPYAVDWAESVVWFSSVRSLTSRSRPARLQRRGTLGSMNLPLLNELGRHHDAGKRLRFLGTPRVEPTNNRAERELRPAVIARKVSHCSKNAAGTEACSALVSVIETLPPWGRRRWSRGCARCGQPGRWRKLLPDPARVRQSITPATPYCKGNSNANRK
ncbi:MAG: transposase [Armatimonadetes bacterium]|nr:transposase [Armatimonadota bacterium]